MTPATRLNDALLSFAGCIGEALDNICSYSLTIGQVYVPFRPDDEDPCDEDETACSQAWVRVASVGSDSDASWGGDCATVLRVSLEVGVLRCLGIPEDGEAPTASEVLVAASQSMDDMNTIFCAAMGCEVWESISSGQWTPIGPLGDQYGGTWTFEVEV